MLTPELAMASDADDTWTLVDKDATDTPDIGHDSKKFTQDLKDGVQDTGKTPQAVTEIDRFMSAAGAVDETEYYKESEEMMQKFQETLKRFTKTLQTRDVFKKLNIEERDPANYDLDYVSKIARSIHDYREGEESTRSIKKFIRRCFRGAHENQTAISCLLEMVPNDIYGSVISGSFSLIMLAIDSHEEERIKVQKALASIPRKLDEVRRLTKVHVKLPELHRCADRLFVAIFVVLERIIDKVSNNMRWRDKLKIRKNNNDGEDIRDAIETMEERVEEFRDEVSVCLQVKMGKIGDDVLAIRENLNLVLRKFDDNETRSSLAAEQTKSGLYSMILDALYQFHAINPALVRPPVLEREASITVDSQRTKELANTWLSNLADFDPMPDKQISYCLRGLTLLDPAEKDRAQWIMASDAVSNWLAPGKSAILNIRSETAPPDLVNALSCSAATLAVSLTEATGCPVLSFFCSLRRKESRENAHSGARAVRKSLNGQLLKYIISKRRKTDLSFLEKEDLMEKSRSKSKYAMELFRKSITALPEDDGVFVILDSFSRLGGDDKEKDGNDLLKGLAKLVEEMPRRVIKILVTDAMPNSPIRDLADIDLYVPDDVDGWRDDHQNISLDEKKLAFMERFKTLEKDVKSFDSGLSDSSGDSDSGWEVATP